jgi:hypothetical protein
VSAQPFFAVEFRLSTRAVGQWQRVWFHGVGETFLTAALAQSQIDGHYAPQDRKFARVVPVEPRKR